MKKNLILTILHQYTYPQIEPFVGSLKIVNYDGDIVMFVSETTSNQTKKKLRSQGITLINYNTKHPFKDEYIAAFKDVTPTITLNNYRFIFYLHYLNAKADQYNKVMLTDLRDVLFQKNPFAQADNESIYFFLEDEVQTFNHKANFDWLAEATDHQTATAMIDNVVSCAGTTIGQINLIIDYLNFMVGKLKFRDKAQWGLDQGIHNSYIYLTNPTAMQLIPNIAPYVATLGAYQPYQLNSRNEVISPDGEPYAVVHQYDRHGDLLVKVKERYIGNRLTQKIKRLYYLLMP